MSHIRAVVTVLLLIASQVATADRVRVETPVGTFFIDLLEEEAPATVANFLNYVNDGDYNGAYIHRSVPGFVIQGGGFTFIDGTFGEVPTDPPVVNEFGRSNVRGTVAMAKVGGDPDSATSQWFINLADNGSILDGQNGGFTVFGVVEGDGMSVVDSIVAQSSIENFGAPNFTTFPVLDYATATELTASNIVFTNISEVAEDSFEIGPGVASTWFDPATAGQGLFVDVIDEGDGAYRLFVGWFTYDNDAPPTDEDTTFGSSQHRWFTALGPVDGATANMDLFRNTGGQFDDPRVTASQRVGTLNMTFQNCNEATLSYNFEVGEGGSGEINMVNLSPDTVCD